MAAVGSTVRDKLRFLPSTGKPGPGEGGAGPTACHPALSGHGAGFTFKAEAGIASRRDESYLMYQLIN